MRTLVTGGAGFLGSHVVRRCLAAGDEIGVLVRPSTDLWRLTNIVDQVALHRIDLGDAAQVAAVLAASRPHRIFHLACETSSRHDDALMVARATRGISDLLTLLTVAANCPSPPRTVVRAGSIAEYGFAPLPFREDVRERPANGYAAALVAGTHFAQTIAPALPFGLVTARLALVYGADQAPDFLVPSLVSALVARRPATVRRPLDRRDLIHVHDAVSALLRLTETPDAVTGGIYNIGSGATIAVGELARRIAVLAAVDPALVHALPQDDPVTLCLDTRHTDRVLGPCCFVPLQDGLSALIAVERAGQLVAAA